MRVDATDEVVFLPYQENMDEELLEDDEFDRLKEKWEKPGYFDYSRYEGMTVDLIDIESNKAIVDELHPPGVIDMFPDMPRTTYENVDDDLPALKDYGDVSKCSGFDIWFFTELASGRELWSRPFDTMPEDSVFCCWHAYDCDFGNVYSKDFAYQECPCCERIICQQNPSNGWMWQFKTIDEDEWGDCQVEYCNKCAEEHFLENGMNIDRMLEDKNYGPAMFMDSGTLEKEGWTQDNDYYGTCVRAFTDRWKEKLEKMKRNNCKVFVEADRMAIGGLEGYITLWYKKEDVKPEIYVLPAFWASALINGDESGMDATEVADMNAWLQAENPGRCVGVSDEQYYSSSCDYHGYVGDVLDYTFILDNINEEE
jgi:hypothetical protein